jgi:hypothetical protein
MQSVYLGLFSSIFKAVYNAILKPIIDFLGGIFNSVFTWVFDNILKPLLIDVFFPLFKGLAEMVYEIIAGMLYELMAEILKIVDAIQVVFNVFAGIEAVTYDKKQYYILDLLFSNQQVQRATWMLIGISLVLMMTFSIISVLRSIADLSDEMKNPVGKILRLTGSSFLKLITIPIVCMLLIRLSGAILKSVYTGINNVVTATTEEDGNSKTTLGRTIFCIATLDAANDSQYNTSTNPDGAGIYDGLRAAYYYSDYTKGDVKDFSNTSVVERDFKYTKMNFILGYGIGILFLYIMASTTFKFINRMFNVIVLYVISPFFACSIPVDEGKNYESWKGMFVGQLFSGYGSVVAMQIYLMIVPSVMSGNIKFLANSTEGDMIVRIVFLVGGGFALMNAGTVITGLISSEAASMETAQGQAFQGALVTAYKLTKAVGQRAGGLLGGIAGKGKGKGGAGGEGGEGAGGEGGEGKEGGEGGKSGSAKFDGKGGAGAGSGAGGKGAKFDGAGGKEGEGAGGAGGAVANNAKKLADNKAAGAGAGGAGGVGAGAGAGGAGGAGAGAGAGGAGGAGAGAGAGGAGGAGAGAGAGGAGGAGAGAGAGGAGGAGAAADAQGQDDQGQEGAAGGKSVKKYKKKKPKAGIKQSFLGGVFVKGKDASGKERWGLNLGKHFNFGLKADGSMGGNVFGISWSKNTGKDDKSSKVSLFGMGGWKTNKEGKLDKVSIPFMRLKRGQDGKMHVSKIRLSKGMQIRRTEQITKDASGKEYRKLGGMYVSDLSAIGMKRRFDGDTGKIETHSMLGKHYERRLDANGDVEYVKTHSNFLGRVSYYERDKMGNYHTVAQKGWLTSESYALDKDTGEKVLMSRMLNNGMSLYQKSQVTYGEGDKEHAPSEEEMTHTQVQMPGGPTLNYTVSGKPEDPSKPKKKYQANDLKGDLDGWVSIDEKPAPKTPHKGPVEMTDMDGEMDGWVDINPAKPVDLDDWVQVNMTEDGFETVETVKPKPAPQENPQPNAQPQANAQQPNAQPGGHPAGQANQGQPVNNPVNVQQQAEVQQPQQVNDAVNVQGGQQGEFNDWVQVEHADVQPQVNQAQPVQQAEQVNQAQPVNNPVNVQPAGQVNQAQPVNNPVNVQPAGQVNQAQPVNNPVNVQPAGQVNQAQPVNNPVNVQPQAEVQQPQQVNDAVNVQGGQQGEFNDWVQVEHADVQPQVNQAQPVQQAEQVNQAQPHVNQGPQVNNRPGNNGNGNNRN